MAFPLILRASSHTWQWQSAEPSGNEAQSQCPRRRGSLYPRSGGQPVSSATPVCPGAQSRLFRGQKAFIRQKAPQNYFTKGRSGPTVSAAGIVDFRRGWINKPKHTKPNTTVMPTNKSNTTNHKQHSSCGFNFFSLSVTPFLYSFGYTQGLAEVRPAWVGLVGW